MRAPGHGPVRRRRRLRPVFLHLSPFLAHTLPQLIADTLRPPLAVHVHSSVLISKGIDHEEANDGGGSTN